MSTANFKHRHAPKMTGSAPQKRHCTCSHRWKAHDHGEKYCMECAWAYGGKHTIRELDDFRQMARKKASDGQPGLCSGYVESVIVTVEDAPIVFQVDEDAGQYRY